MLSGHCHSEAYSATPDTAPEYHARCAGAWPRPDGVVVSCPCPQHAGEYRCRNCRHEHTTPDDFDITGRQCADHDACTSRISRAHPQDTPIRKQLREAAPRTGRDCECACGGTTRGGRFMPGHDAKLTSLLLAAAKQGDEAAREDLRRRGWERK